MSIGETVEAAVQEALAGQQVIGNVNREQTAGPTLRQRGRTGTVTAFDSKHKRGAHGRFAYEGGKGKNASPKAAPKTPEEIKRFQKEYGLAQTGKLDAATRATIASPPPQTVSGMADSEAKAKTKAEATKRKESRAKTEAKRKEEGKPPVGAKAAKSTSKGTATSSSTGTGGTVAGASTGPLAGRAAVAAIRKDTSGTTALGKLNISENLAVGTGLEPGKEPSPAVGLLQAKLQTLGFNLGTSGVDGKFGPATQVAVKVLQREYGLPPDGVVGSQTLQLLESLIERSQKWSKHGIIAAERMPEEGVGAYVERIVAASSF